MFITAFKIIFIWWQILLFKYIFGFGFCLGCDKDFTFTFSFLYIFLKTNLFLYTGTIFFFSSSIFCSFFTSSVITLILLLFSLNLFVSVLFIIFLSSFTLFSLSSLCIVSFLFILLLLDSLSSVYIIILSFSFFSVISLLLNWLLFLFSFFVLFKYWNLKLLVGTTTLFLVFGGKKNLFELYSKLVFLPMFKNKLFRFLLGFIDCLNLFFLLKNFLLFFDIEFLKVVDKRIFWKVGIFAMILWCLNLLEAPIWKLNFLFSFINTLFFLLFFVEFLFISLSSNFTNFWSVVDDVGARISKFFFSLFSIIISPFLYFSKISLSISVLLLKNVSISFSNSSLLKLFSAFILLSITISFDGLFCSDFLSIIWNNKIQKSFILLFKESIKIFSSKSYFLIIYSAKSSIVCFWFISSIVILIIFIIFFNTFFY